MCSLDCRRFSRWIYGTDLDTFATLNQMLEIKWEFPSTSSFNSEQRRHFIFGFSVGLKDMLERSSYTANVRWRGRGRKTGKNPLWQQQYNSFSRFITIHQMIAEATRLGRDCRDKWLRVGRVAELPWSVTERARMNETKDFTNFSQWFWESLSSSYKMESLIYIEDFQTY